MLNPKLYRRHVSVTINANRNLYEKYGKHLKWKEQPEIILDVGIGDGIITNEVIIPFIPNAIEEYIGCDISDIMIESVESLIKHPRFKTLKLDITTKEIPENLLNKFSHIFANYALHAFSDISQAVTNIYNMIQPGGQFFFNGFLHNPQNEGYLKMDQTKWAKYCNRKALSCFHDSDDVKGEYAKLLKRVGFNDVYVYENPSKIFYSKEDMDEMLEAVNFRLAFVDEKDRNEYLKDFVNLTKQTKDIYFVPEVNQYVIQTNLLTGIATKP